jgi:hypothetical protein
MAEKSAKVHGKNVPKEGQSSGVGVQEESGSEVAENVSNQQENSVGLGEKKRSK